MGDRLHAGGTIAPAGGLSGSPALSTGAIMQVDFNRGRWSPSTRQAYESHWKDWEAWCAARGVEAFPSDPADIAAFITERAETLSHSSVSGRQGAILSINALYGNVINVKATVIRDASSEIRRTKGTASTPKTAIDDKALKRIIRNMPAELIQERALLLVGFSSAMRRSELVALNVDDLEPWPPSEDGFAINIRHSKTDKSGKGERIGVPRSGGEFCAVAALEAWLSHAGITEGPVFRGAYGERMAARRVATLAKRWAGKAGFTEREIGAHSLRRGCITTMNAKGIDLKSGMEHSRHRTPTIYLGYVQRKAAMDNPAVKALRL
jgi:site-specific recombinase XerC